LLFFFFRASRRNGPRGPVGVWQKTWLSPRFCGLLPAFLFPFWPSSFRQSPPGLSKRPFHFMQPKVDLQPPRFFWRNYHFVSFRFSTLSKPPFIRFFFPNFFFFVSRPPGTAHSLEPVSPPPLYDRPQLFPPAYNAPVSSTLSTCRVPVVFFFLICGCLGGGGKRLRPNPLQLVFSKKDVSSGRAFERASDCFFPPSFFLLGSLSRRSPVVFLMVFGPASSCLREWSFAYFVASQILLRLSFFFVLLHHIPLFFCNVYPRFVQARMLTFGPPVREAPLRSCSVDNFLGVSRSFGPCLFFFCSSGSRFCLSASASIIRLQRKQPSTHSSGPLIHCVFPPAFFPHPRPQIPFSTKLSFIGRVFCCPSSFLAPFYRMPSVDPLLRMAPPDFLQFALGFFLALSRIRRRSHVPARRCVLHGESDSLCFSPFLFCFFFIFSRSPLFPQPFQPILRLAQFDGPEVLRPTTKTPIFFFAPLTSASFFPTLLCPRFSPFPDFSPLIVG